MEEYKYSDDYRQEFGALLRNKVISPVSSIMEEQYSQLVDVVTKMPDRLFRYRSCNNNNRNAFFDNSIYCVKASEFNDIQDSLFYYNADDIISRLRDNMFYDSPGRLWDYFSDKQELPPIIENLSPDIKQQIIEKLQLPKSQFLAQINENRFSESDINELKREIKAFSISLRDSSRIACFCENYDSQLMWAHYGDYHKGFVLEYAKQDILNIIHGNPIRIFPIVYTNERYLMDEHLLWQLIQYISIRIIGQSDEIMPDVSFLEKMYLFKSIDWSYENEWRLIYCDLKNQDPIYKIEGLKPVAIHYGIRINEEDRNDLSVFAKGNEIKEYQMTIDDVKEYRLIREVI